MALLYPIVAGQTDAKSPIDQALMDAIRLNLVDLESRIVASASFDYQFKINGPLELLPAQVLSQQLASPASFVRFKRADGGLISKTTDLQECRILLASGGNGGDIEVDVRKATKPNVEITAVQALYRASIQSIGRAGSAISTQSISRATSQINTQSIARFKSAINISSIISMGLDPATNTQLWKINLASAPDTDYVGQSITLASTTGATNDGTFTCVRVKDDGGNNLVIANAAGANQSSAAGTVELNLWKYTFTNPVSTHFAAGENVLMAAHTSGVNDGSFEIYTINSGGNNIIVKNTAGTAQAGVAGTADTKRWKYVTSSAVSSTDYVVGESAFMQSHSSGANDGTFPIRAVNDGGNNVVVYNNAGVVQGGAAGTIDTCRWVYAFSSDPASFVSAAHNIIFTAATTAANNGTFVVKEVNRSAGTNLVVHNTAGIAQGGAVGTAVTARKKVKFATTQADITTDSRIFVVNCPTIPEDDYDVLVVNLGGGANYNAIIETTSTTEQDGPCGRVAMETKSVFDTRPKITMPPQSYNFAATHYQVSSNMVLNATRKSITAGTLVFLDILSSPQGARDLTVQLL